jgi:hypothetical protein
MMIKRCRFFETSPVNFQARYLTESWWSQKRFIYLFLSSKMDFVAFSRISTTVHKTIQRIDSVGYPLFSMRS